MKKFQSLKYLREAGSLRGKRVLIRLDLNVPIEGDRVVDDFRLKSILPTLRSLHESKAKTAIIAHIENDYTDSLEPVYHHLFKSIDLRFGGDPLRNGAHKMVEELEEGEILLFENLRLYAGEEKNDKEFARELSRLGDIYVNEAFSVSHRAHASIVGVPSLLPSFAGPLFERELKHLERALSPERPALLILGGSKFETKIPLIERYLKSADWIFVGGALANDLFRARGYSIGTSLVSKKKLSLEKIVENSKILTPTDALVSGNDGEKIKKPNELSLSDMIVDIGPETIEELGKIIGKSKTIIWNGPLGIYEKKFTKGSEELAKIISESKANSLVGGGDTVAVIRKFHMDGKFGFISTAGGAMLDFLAEGTLVGIEALENSI